MRDFSRSLAALLVVCYLVSLAGCAAPPKKEEINQKDVLIQNLTEENSALRKEINRLSEEGEALRRGNLKLKSQMRTQKEKAAPKNVK